MLRAKSGGGSLLAMKNILVLAIHAPNKQQALFSSIFNLEEKCAGNESGQKR